MNPQISRGLPYVSTLLLIFTCIVSISTQHHVEKRLFNAGEFYIPPAPIYPDTPDYGDPNQYPDYTGSLQNEPVEKIPWPATHNLPSSFADDDTAGSRLNFTPTWVPNWPSPSVSLGQISAVTIDPAGRVVVFHRGTHIWDQTTFTRDNHYSGKSQQPISASTIVVLNATTGDVVDQWGENLFYMPHGITVDNLNNVWITDVALHQVMKFSSGDKLKPSMVLGVSFTPGNDHKHFCKPSGVAVMESGEFFVSDGYCNTRIIKFSAEGRRLIQWGKNTFRVGQTIPNPYMLAVPHAVVVAEDKGLVCVADRENGRVQCYHCSNGTFFSQYHSPIIGSRIFSVAYSPIKGGQLYVVNGPEATSHVIRGYVIDMTTKKLVSQFGPHGTDFSNPHDVAVSKDGKQVYVVELSPYKIHKFIDKTIPEETLSDSSVPVTTLPGLALANRPLYPKTSPAPAKPTATVEGLGGASGWGGWGVTGGAAGGVGAVLLLLLGGAALLARARHRGGCLSPLTPRNRRQRWDYAPGAPDFKFRHLLERPRGAGFERINTEESDEEATPATSMLAPQNA